jgi:ketohexokinase
MNRIANAAAEALERAALPPALVGFDGFIDSITDVVERREDARRYTRIPTIAAFAARCAGAAGRSANIERVVRERRFGGNGPLMASALARLGAPVTYIGAVGVAGPAPVAVHPLFAPFAAGCRRVIATGPPSETDCLEFEDGKLMLNDRAAVQAVTWERIVGVAGPEELRRIVGEAGLIGMVNWSLLLGAPGIWRGLLRDVLPHVARQARHVFVDLADPSGRSDADVAGAMALLAELGRAGATVTLGLNQAEAVRVGAVVGARGCEGLAADDARAADAAASIRERIGVDCVVVHCHESAAAARAEGVARFGAAYTSRPRLLTGAGDHFGAGFGLGRTIGAPLDQCLALGCAVAGVYVRDGASPGRERVAGFLRAWPGGEEVRRAIASS